jgi:hypothetical protein
MTWMTFNNENNNYIKWYLNIFKSNKQSENNDFHKQ